MNNVAGKGSTGLYLPAKQTRTTSLILHWDELKMHGFVDERARTHKSTRKIYWTLRETIGFVHPYSRCLFYKSKRKKCKLRSYDSYHILSSQFSSAPSWGGLVPPFPILNWPLQKMVQGHSTPSAGPTSVSESAPLNRSLISVVSITEDYIRRKQAGSHYLQSYLWGNGTDSPTIVGPVESLLYLTPPFGKTRSR